MNFPLNSLYKVIKKCTEILELQLEYQKVEKKLLEQWAKDDNCTVSDLVNNLERF